MSEDRPIVIYPEYFDFNLKIYVIKFINLI